MSAFGEALRQARLGAGLSQNELGRRAGINPGTINRLETGEREPTGREMIAALAEALTLPPADRDRLLAAADLLPDPLARLGAADPTLVLVADILADERIPAGERADFRLQIELAARRWRPRELGSRGAEEQRGRGAEEQA
jgi:transcriptional regulator with XRE-family HTH domain